MMIIDDDAGEQLRAWLAARVDRTVMWMDQPDRYLPDDYLILGVLDIAKRGQDGVRYALDVGTGKLVPTVVGQREFTLRVEARAWSQELSQTAGSMLLPLQAALCMPAAEQLFNALNIGLIGSGPVHTVDVIVDERAQSRAVMDIRFATSIQLTDANDAQDYIASVEYVATLSGGGSGDTAIDDSVWDAAMTAQLAELISRVTVLEAQVAAGVDPALLDRIAVLEGQAPGPLAIAWFNPFTESVHAQMGSLFEGITRVSAGVYEIAMTVFFPNSDRYAGVLLSALDVSPRIMAFAISGSTLTVRSWDAAGALIDTAFVAALFTPYPQG
ncbi:MAG TPA: hypothetical protein VGO53_16100 [Steroidobacteraceae bacterium]|jgi:hypothetical protein|nr:hypothetical protein [Steroidobacteraceae bacterium]